MDKVISIYWFVILAIIATALVIMTAAFYNAPYDVRGIEARILADKAADCISSGGMLKDYVFQNNIFSSEFNQNFLDICKINLNAENVWTDPQYYIKVEFFNLDSNGAVFSIEKGNLNFISSCSIQESEDFKKLTQCYEGKFYAVSEKNQFLIKISTAVGKSIKNVK